MSVYMYMYTYSRELFQLPTVVKSASNSKFWKRFKEDDSPVTAPPFYCNMVVIWAVAYE